MCKSKSNDILQWLDLSGDIFCRLFLSLLIWLGLERGAERREGEVSARTTRRRRRRDVLLGKWFHLILSSGSASTLYPNEIRRSSETALQTRYHSQLIYSWHSIDRVINQLSSLVVFVVLLFWYGWWQAYVPFETGRDALPVGGTLTPWWFRSAVEASANIIFIIHRTGHLFSSRRHHSVRVRNAKEFISSIMFSLFFSVSVFFQFECKFVVMNN